MKYKAYYLPSYRCRKCLAFYIYADHRIKAIRQARQIMKEATEGRGVLINVLEKQGGLI